MSDEKMKETLDDLKATLVYMSDRVGGLVEEAFDVRAELWGEGVTYTSTYQFDELGVVEQMLPHIDKLVSSIKYLHQEMEDRAKAFASWCNGSTTGEGSGEDS